MGIVRAILSAIMTGSPLVVAVCTFMAYQGIYGALPATTIFPALAYFNLMRMPMTFFPLIMSLVIEALVSLQRLQDFFNQEEILQLPKANNTEVPVKIEQASFEWDAKPIEGAKKKKEAKPKKSFIKRKQPKTQDIELKDAENVKEVGKLNAINLQVKKGELCFIVGKYVNRNMWYTNTCMQSW